MSEEAKPTNDPCAVCGRPVDSHTPNEATNCRNNRQPSLIPEAKQKPQTIATTSTSTVTTSEGDSSGQESKEEAQEKKA